MHTCIIIETRSRIWYGISSLNRLWRPPTPRLFLPAPRVERKLDHHCPLLLSSLPPNSISAEIRNHNCHYCRNMEFKTFGKSGKIDTGNMHNRHVRRRIWGSDLCTHQETRKSDSQHSSVQHLTTARNFNTKDIKKNHRTQQKDRNTRKPNRESYPNLRRPPIQGRRYP